MNPLEVRIPIGPTASMFNRVQLLVESIRALGPAYEDTHFRVTVGSDSVSAYELFHHKYASNRPDIEWYYLPVDEFLAWKGTNNEHIATMSERMKPPFKRDNVLLLDADVICLRDFSEALDSQDDFLAMMAHTTPFPSNHFLLWRSCYKAFGLDEPDFSFKHSGAGIIGGSNWLSPPYFNTGVTFCKADPLTALYPVYMDALKAVRGALNSYFFDQIAFTLALVKQQSTIGMLGPSYNFPNDPAFEQEFPDFNEIRFLHYLRTSEVDRNVEFSSKREIERFMARQHLTGTNAILQKRVQELFPRITFWAS